MNLKCFLVTDDERLEPTSAEGLSRAWMEDESRRWLDIEAPEPEELEELLKPLGLHPLVLEGCCEPRRSARVMAYEEAVFLELPLHIDSLDAGFPYVIIVCLRTTLLTIHDESLCYLNEVMEHFSSRARLFHASTEVLLYHFLDHVIDANVEFLMETRKQLVQLARTFFQDPGQVEMRDMYTVKRRIVRTLTVGEDQLYCARSLGQAASRTDEASHEREYFQDLVQNLEHVIRSANGLDQRWGELHEQRRAYVQSQTEKRLKILTIVSAVFLPMTLIAGIYGMNFRDIPELSWPAGYPYALGVMATVAGGMLWFFYRRRWFD